MQFTEAAATDEQAAGDPDITAGVDLHGLEASVEKAIALINALRDQRDVYVAALKEARGELEIVFHKFERAGGIWEVAHRGVPLGAMSWASNVENGLNNTRAVLDAAIAKATK